MRRRHFLAAACSCVLCAGAARPSDLIEPHMHFVPSGAAPEVCMTLDACMGATDHRILDTLIGNAIPATIFATRRWLDHNPDVVKTLLAHKDLFAVENHGAMHIPAIIGTETAYGIAPAGTADAVFAEVEGGQQAVTAALGIAPRWYRDATALYTQDAINLIGTMSLRIAGFSLNGDLGASVPAAIAQKRIAAARSGDVIISHINQPTRSSGQGVADGLLELKASGFRFLHLDDVTMRSGLLV
ncbi:MAG TPA: polysaccharide deacetylase family protein [Devosia sp.]|nr:polysaccharide deacetylase family protein [Devosia sp.]